VAGRLAADQPLAHHAESDTLTGQVLLPNPRLGHTVQASVLPKQNVAGSNPVSRSNVLSRDIGDT